MSSAVAARPVGVPALLKTDAAFRTSGVKGDLIPLEELRPMSWDFSAPTLISDFNPSLYSEHTICPDSKTLAAVFFAKYPMLRDVGLTNLLIAGGSVGQFVGTSGKKWTASDVDIFVYGLKNAAAATARVHAFIESLDAAYHADQQKQVHDRLAKEVAQIQTQSAFTIEDGIKFALFEEFDSIVWTKNGSRMVPKAIAGRSNGETYYEPMSRQYSYKLPKIDTIRTAGSITIKRDNVKLQVILRLYSTVSEILHGFDLGSSAVGFDGQNVILTSLGRFAYEYGYNIVDTTRRSTSYEARLTKYCRRGFDIIVPQLNIAALSRRNLSYRYAEIADLPTFPFAYTKIDGNQITVEKFIYRGRETSDYDLSEEMDNGGFSLAYINLYRLVNNKPDFIYWAGQRGYSSALNVLSKPPHLSLAMIHGLYHQFRESVWSSAGRLNHRTIQRYLPVVPIQDIFESVYGATTNMRNSAIQDVCDSVPAYDAANRTMSAVLADAFAKQLDDAVHLWHSHIGDMDHSVLPWVTENPGGQQSPLTGSFNPIMKNPVDWYGAYLLAGNAETVDPPELSGKSE